MRLRRFLWILVVLVGVVALAVLAAALLLADRGALPMPEPAPSPTPRPTWTPTPTREGIVPSPISILPTPTPPPTATPTPTWTPSPLPTATPTPTITPSPTATPTPTPNYAFELEDFEPFPARLIEGEAVRIFAYIYSPTEFALPGYSLLVRHDGIRLPVEAQSTGGLPELTRQGPSPYARFTNLQLQFAGPPGGTWEIQLIDAKGTPVGPPAVFTLLDDSPNWDLYVRYRRR